MASAVGIFLFYWPPKPHPDFPRMPWKLVIWECDPIGSLLFIVSATLLLLALDWAGGSYKWSDPHVAANLTIGLVSLIAFGLYGKEFLITSRYVADRIQNGKGEMTDLLLMSSSGTVQTLLSLSLHLPWRGKSSFLTSAPHRKLTSSADGSSIVLLIVLRHS